MDRWTNDYDKYKTEENQFRIYDGDEADIEIHRLRMLAYEMLTYFTGARDGYMGEMGKVKTDITASCKQVEEWIMRLKEDNR